MRKIEFDDKSQIMLTKKALAQYDLFQKQNDIVKKETLRDQKKEETKKESKAPIKKEKNLNQFLPGLPMIKDILIKPLLFATEKVVEYCFVEEQKQEQKSD